jgi:hypothetical protein
MGFSCVSFKWNWKIPQNNGTMPEGVNDTAIMLLPKRRYMN